jgi:hypothetical protein
MKTEYWMAWVCVLEKLEPNPEVLSKKSKLVASKRPGLR